MSPLRRWAAIALVVAAVVSPAQVWAQGEWDPDRYLHLTRDGRALYESALGEEPGSEAWESTLTEAGRHMKEALAMVRAALASGEYDDAERAAMRDYFTLMENLSVVWLTLDACGPAQRLMDEARANPELQPDDEALFTNLEPRLSACHERAGTWAWSRYQGLVARADLRSEQARARAVPDRTLLGQAAEASAAALEAYRAALLRGALGPAPVADPVAELFARAEVTHDLQLDAGLCGAAADTAAAAEADRQWLLQAQAGPMARAGELATCSEGVVSIATFEGESEGEGPGRGAPLDLRLAGGWSLVGASVVLGASAATVAATAADGGGDREVATYVLLGTAGAALAGGLAVLLSGGSPAPEPGDDGPPAESEVSVGPWVAPGGWGAAVGGSF